MSNDIPTACSLSAGELQQRLTLVAEVGADSLVSRNTEGDRHLLRFHASPTTRQRLEDIIAAEAACCAFLDLSLIEEGDQLVLSIGAPKDAKALADGFAEAFTGVAA